MIKLINFNEISKIKNALRLIYKTKAFIDKYIVVIYNKIVIVRISERKNIMDLNGLTVNFLGDSITEGYGVIEPGNVYHQIIKEKYNLKQVYNYGISGTRIARQTVPSADCPRNDLYFELRSEIMQPSADVIVVFGGTNDYAHGDAAFGTQDSEDVYTFCGAVNSLINKLRRDFPKAKIIFMTPLHRTFETNLSDPDSKILEDYAKAISEICNKRNIDVIDLFKINPLDPEDKELVPDGLHPNDKGHSIMADVIGKELLKI